jgi:predicted nucleotidyltransferase
MSTSNQTYKSYSFADHKEVYLKLEAAFKKFDVHYYLIGANARDVQMYKAGSKPNRGTADIDFAVMLPTIELYQIIRDHLKKDGFEDTRGNMPYRMYYPMSNTVIDLLPYGEFALESTVNFPDRDIELSVVGMNEVGAISESFEHPEGFSIPVTPAHGIVILKLISWSEKPDTRSKDLQDIKALLDIAWELYEDELYTENSRYADLFDAEDFDQHRTAARVMGRKMQGILNLNEALRNTLIAELDEELDQLGPKTKFLATDTSATAEEIQQLFAALKTGIEDPILKRIELTFFSHELTNGFELTTAFRTHLQSATLKIQKQSSEEPDSYLIEEEAPENVNFLLRKYVREAIILDIQLKLPKNEHSSLKFQDIAGTLKISFKEELLAELKDLTNY